MATDLTERLAAKLAEDVYPSSLWAEKPAHVSFHEIASIAHDWLPLLLSEPELVAGLDPEVRDEVLAVLMSAKVREANAKQDKLAAVCWLNALGRLPDAALAEARALSPEVGNGK